MADREIERWVTVNGRKVPIYKDNGHANKSSSDISVEVTNNLGIKKTLKSNVPYFIFRLSGILSEYGERCYLIEVQDKHLVFKTESGTTFKTDYKLNTVGKAKKAGYEFHPADRTDDKHMKHSIVHF